MLLKSRKGDKKVEEEETIGLWFIDSATMVGLRSVHSVAMNGDSYSEPLLWYHVKN